MLPALPAATIAYALLEDLAAASFIAAARLRRGVNPAPLWLIAALLIAVGAVAAGSFGSGSFLDVYRLHSAFFALLLGAALVEVLRARIAGLGGGLLVVVLAALTIDYAHVPVLTALGVAFPDNYLGLESYVTLVLDIALGVALVVRSTDGANVELTRRNAALGAAQRALQKPRRSPTHCAASQTAPRFSTASRAPPADGTFAMIDLDGLKAINDRFGHAAGDAALEMTARVLRDRCGDGGAVYRIGGDEFAGIWDGVDRRVRARAARRPASVTCGSSPKTSTRRCGSRGASPRSARAPRFPRR